MQVHKILFLIVLLCSTNVFSADGIWSKQLTSVLQKNGLAANQYGIEIKSLDGKQVYFSANGEKTFNPASTIKTLISIIALEQLGPNYKFSTLLKKQGNDLCIVGGGDPALVYEDVFLMVEEFMRSPIEKHFNQSTIGNLIVDESFYPTDRSYGDLFEDDFQRSFTTPISSLSVNYNSVTVIVRGSTPGQKPFVTTEPRLKYFTVQNSAKTSATKTNTIQADVTHKNGSVVIQVAGQISADQEVKIYRAVIDPPTYVGVLFKDLFERAGGNMSGAVQKKACSANATLLVDYKSKPLSQTILGMNKFSNNFIAESLLYHVGPQPNSKSGLEKMRSWMREKNLPIKNVSIDNASGLSRSNTVTPDFMWNLYAYGRNQFSIFPELVSSFGIAGTDGTLRRRFKSAVMERQVRAKSGSLKNTVSLVGSIQTASKGELLFTFLFELNGKSMGTVQGIEEDLLEAVAKLGS